MALDLSGDATRALTGLTGWVGCVPDSAVFGAGGADKNAVVFEKDTEQIVATLKGHAKKVTGVVYHPKEVNNKQQQQIK